MNFNQKCGAMGVQLIHLIPNLIPINLTFFAFEGHKKIEEYDEIISRFYVHYIGCIIQSYRFTIICIT